MTNYESILLDAAALIRLVKASKLKIGVPDSHLPGIAYDIAAALVRYASDKMQEQQKQGAEFASMNLASVAKRGIEVSCHARRILALLDADYRGPEGDLPLHVPVPGWLIADPARRVPGIGEEIALDIEETHGDAARDAMMSEAGIHIEVPSLWGAHDVARVAVAALRQLNSLAETAAKHAASIRPTPYKPAVPALFAALSDLFETLHGGKRYTVSNLHPPADTSQLRNNQPGGRAMRWTLELFRHAADAAAAANMPDAAALRQLADHYQKRRDGLARRIRETGLKPRRRQSFQLKKRPE